jgi:peptidoglycan DL-endopeptidase CwlO
VKHGIRGIRDVLVMPVRPENGWRDGIFGRRCRIGGQVLVVTAALLTVAAGWPAGGRTSSARAQMPAAHTSSASADLGAPAAAPAGPVPAMIPGGDQPPPPAASPIRQLLPADLLVVSAGPLPAGAAAAVRSLPGVRAAEPVEAARVRVNGRLAAVLGVDPSAFRRFAARPTAAHTALWTSVADGAIAVSYTMGRQAKMPTGSLVKVAGRKLETLRVGGLGTVGIAGVDAVVSRSVARSLGFPAGNALVVSAPHAALRALKRKIKAVVPPPAMVEQLVMQARPAAPASPGVAGAPAGSGAGGTGGLLTLAQTTAFLRAALSRVGLPYVWGAAGPGAFDCSGLVQWSLAQAGVVMPRVAADQARTGPAVPVSQLQPGDLLFYRTDPTAPDYISHVAIYLGQGRMVQAPEPGMNVEVVPVDLSGGFAGAVAVAPAVAASAAASPVG